MKRYIKSIYDAISKSGLSAHRYTDSNYYRVEEMRYLAQSAVREHLEDARVICESVEDERFCKRYFYTIESEYTGAKYGGGVIVAAFCGSVGDVRSAYDVTGSWWDAD